MVLADFEEYEAFARVREEMLLGHARENAGLLSHANLWSRRTHMPYGYPNYVVSPGPSLTEQVPHLRAAVAYRGGGVVYTGSRALPLLYEAHVEVDACVIVDPTIAVLEHFDRMDDACIRHPLRWLVTPTVHPEVIRRIQKASRFLPLSNIWVYSVVDSGGRTFFEDPFWESVQCDKDWRDSGDPKDHSIPCGGSVSTVCFSLAALHGDEFPIVLVGQDCAVAPDGRMHAEGAGNQVVDTQGSTSTLALMIYREWLSLSAIRSAEARPSEWTCDGDPRSIFVKIRGGLSIPGFTDYDFPQFLYEWPRWRRPGHKVRRGL